MEEINIKEFIGIINKWKIMIISITIALSLTSFIASKFIIKPQYSASSTLIVGNTKMETDSQLDINALTTYNKLTATYAKVIKSRNVLDDVRDRLDFKVSTDALDDMITVTPQTDTQLIDITVKNGTPKRAAQIVNQVSKSFISKISEIMKIEQNVHIVDKASVSKSPVSPNVKLNVAIAFLLGIMIGVGIAFLIEYLDDTIKTPEDIEKCLGLPVIGTIPMITEELAAKGGHSNA